LTPLVPPQLVSLDCHRRCSIAHTFAYYSLRFSFQYSPPISASTDGRQEHCLIPHFPPPPFFGLHLQFASICKYKAVPPFDVKLCSEIPEIHILAALIVRAMLVICLPSFFFPQPLCGISELTNPLSASSSCVFSSQTCQFRLVCLQNIKNRLRFSLSPSPSSSYHHESPTQAVNV